MLDVRHLSCVRGHCRLFAGIDFALQAGEVLYVRGDNGAGKTSLLRILSGLTPPTNGTVRWQGQEIHRLGASFRAAVCHIGHALAIKGDLSPLENLLFMAAVSGQPLKTAAATQALSVMGLSGREHLPCRYLSQGQQRRVALARLVNEQRPLWILDEPFVALDAQACTDLVDLLAKHLQAGGLVVLTTHQPLQMRDFSVQELSL